MSKVPLHPSSMHVLQRLQGYLAHEKHPPRRTLQEDYALSPMVVLGRWVFLMRGTPALANSNTHRVRPLKFQETHHS